MRQEKQLLLNEIHDKIRSSNAFIVARYQKMTASTITEFRKLVAKTGGDFEVVRKRVFIKAAEECGLSLSKEDYEGHIGIVFAKDDPVQVTKTVYDFLKENDVLEVLGGQFDGKMIPAGDIEKLSKLPNLAEMRAQFLGLLEAPMAQTLGVMDALLTSVIHCLENKRQKEEA